MSPLPVMRAMVAKRLLRCRLRMGRLVGSFSRQALYALTFVLVVGDGGAPWVQVVARTSPGWAQTVFSLPMIVKSAWRQRYRLGADFWSLKHLNAV